MSNERVLFKQKLQKIYDEMTKIYIEKSLKKLEYQQKQTRRHRHYTFMWIVITLLSCIVMLQAYSWQQIFVLENLEKPRQWR